MLEAENTIGATGVYQILKVVAEAFNQEVWELDEVMVAQWAGVKRDRARRILEFAQKILTKTREISCKSDQNLQKSSKNLSDFTPSNPLPTSLLIERPEKTDKDNTRDHGHARVNQVNLKKTSCPKKLRFSDAHLEIANYIFQKIRELNPEHKQPNLEKWAEEIRLMEERDKRPLDAIKELFSWANAHAFWRKSILCPTSLREKWDRLQIDKTCSQPAQIDKRPYWQKLKDARFVVLTYDPRKQIDLDDFQAEPINRGGVLYFRHLYDPEVEYAVNELQPEKQLRRLSNISTLTAVKTGTG